MINTHCRTPSPCAASSMGVSTSEQLSRLRKLSVERGQVSSPPTAASVSVAAKPVLRKGKAVDLGELEGESGVSKNYEDYHQKKWF